MVSLVDKEIQYIIAEVTRTSDIEGIKKPIVDEDGLLLGCEGSLARGDSLCQFAMSTPLPEDGYAVFQVADLAKEERTKHIPVVSQPPHLRFYAGTPLLTNEGHRVGTLSVLDSKTRAAFDDNEQHFFGLMAASVMTYLNLQKDRQESSRYAKMTTGLTQLVTQGHDGSVDADASDDDDPMAVSEDNHFSHSTFEITRGRSREQGPVSARPYRDVFTDASEILRLSLNADLTILAEDFAEVKTWSEDRDMRVGLACSEAKRPHLESILAFKHPPNMIETLRKRWPLGKLWIRDDNNNFVGTADVRYRDLSPFSRRSSSRSSDTQPDSDECDWLHDWLPKARQVMFLPVWDHDHKSSACFVMSQHNLPAYSVQIEVPFIRAFLNSLSVICGQLTLQIADRQKSQLLSSVSHELRSPLHGIIAAVEMLTTTSLDPSQVDLCENIDVCSQTLLDTLSLVMDHTMVNSFIDGQSRNPFEKQTIHAGSSLHLESVCNLAVIVEEGIEITRSAFSNLVKSSGAYAQCSDFHVDIDFRAMRGDWNFSCRPGILRRLVTNLVSNALKYTSSGSIMIDLTQTLENDSEQSSERSVVLSVTDTGKGMSTAFQKNGIFQPFSQESSTAPGLGLGLSIVEASVRSLMGTIDVKSVEGKGTAIQISFPVRHPSPAEGSAPSLQRHGSADFEPCTSPQSKTYRITSKRLLDSTRCLETLREYLGGWWQYREIEDGAVEVDYAFVDEADTVNASSRHLIVVTHSSLADSLKNKHNDKRVYLRMPFGPKAVRKALTASQTADVSTRQADNNSEQHSAVEPLQPPSDLPAAAPKHHTSNSSPPNLSKSLSATASPVIRASHTSSTAPSPPKAPLIKPVRPTHNLSDIHQARSDTVITTKSKPLPSSPASSAISVLCVDDNPINLSLLQKYCARMGLTKIDTATDGLQAYNKSRGANPVGNKGGRIPYDVIFMDLTMPIMDGFESTRKIREYEAERKSLVAGIEALALGSNGNAQGAAERATDESGLKAIGNALNDIRDEEHEHKGKDGKGHSSPGPKIRPTTIIAITALGSEADQKKAFAAGVDHFVTKPMRPRDLEVLLSDLGFL